MQGINSIKMSGIQSGQLPISSMQDAETKRLQSQIEEVWRQIQNVTADENMTIEQKQKKKQELEEKMADLQDQLQQHLSEQRQEQQEERIKTAEQKPYDETGMQSVISSEATLKYAEIQEAAADRMENRAVVLKSEMELDAGRNRGPIKSKEKELMKAEQGAENARSSQMQILGKTNRNLADAVEAEQDPEEARKEKEEKEAAKKATPLMYTSEGKPVTEEEEAHITVRA